MRALHLKRIGEIWHYQRRRPQEYADIEPRRLIRFSLRTTDFHEARLSAARYSVELDQQWAEAKARGVSLVKQDAAARYAAAAEFQQQAGFAPRATTEIPDPELLARLHALLTEDRSPPERKALLGVVERPALTLSAAFDRFWEHIKDEWLPLSEDQRRIKRNAYLKSIHNFEAQVGPVTLYDIRRQHALKFRAWHVEQVTCGALKAQTSNRQITAMRRLLRINFDIDATEGANPFDRLRLKTDHKETRAPFSTEFLRDQLLASGALSDLPEALQVLTRLLINTGLRPSEAVGLAAEDIDLNHEVPHVHIRRNAVRSLKTDHSDRKIPLLGVSFEAAQELVRIGGRWPDEAKKFCAKAAAISPWGRWAGKNMYATTLINRHFRESGLVTDPGQSLYSLRHWFQDQLTRLDVVDRAQAQLMGHKFHRPKYGHGKDLAELRGILAQFAL